MRDTVEAATRVSTPDASTLATPSTATVTSTCDAVSEPAATEGAVSVSYTRISVSGCQDRAEAALKNRRAVA